MKAVKIAVSVVVVLGGLGGLVYSTTGGSAFEYYKHVDEVVDELPRWQKKPLQLHGFVLPGSIERKLDRDRQQLDYRFIAVNCGRQVRVTYSGSIPDTFKDGAEVVCKGEFLADATGGAADSAFRSTEIMAKCPSKYQATSGGPNPMCARGRGN